MTSDSNCQEFDPFATTNLFLADLICKVQSQCSLSNWLRVKGVDSLQVMRLKHSLSHLCALILTVFLNLTSTEELSMEIKLKGFYDI